MARPPPFLRTQSSPILPPVAVQPPSSLTDTLIASLPLPLLVFDPSLRLHSINAAGRAAFGLSGTGSDDFIGAGAADLFSSSSFEGDSELPVEGLRNELLRLAREQSGWEACDPLECKNGSTITWWAEARVQTFVPESPYQLATGSRGSSSGNLVDGLNAPSFNSPLLSTDSSSPTGSLTPTRQDRLEWFSVLLLRPVPTPSTRPTAASSARRTSSNLAPLRRQGSSSDRTPTLTATDRGDPFGGQIWPIQQQPEEEEMEGVEPGSSSHEASWSHKIPSGGSALSKEKLAASAAEREGRGEFARPPLPLRLSALPSPGTPPLSSNGTASSKSSRGSLLSNGTVASSSGSSGATSTHSHTFSSGQSSAPDATPKAVVGMGISVSSAGIHLSQSHPLVTEVPHPDVAPASIAAHPSSPRPTSLPPPPPIFRPQRPEPPALLRFAALSNLPKTGVIIADQEFQSGFVNPLARELLMGVPVRKAPDHPEPQPSTSEAAAAGFASHASAPVDEWWTSGQWTADDSWSSLSSGTAGNSDGSSFFPLASAHSDRPNPFDAKDLMHAAIIASGEARQVEKHKGSAGSSIRIGKPQETNRYRTTVAAILARSLVTVERSEAQGGNEASRRWASREAPTLTKGKDSTDPGHSTTSTPTKEGRGHGITSGPSFVGVGTKQGKKPYKVYDHSFSQRIVDPFEPLLEICARRGEHPASVGDEDVDEDQAASGIIVGIEVEVWEAAPGAGQVKAEGTFVTSEDSTARRKRVRRRLVEVTAAPIFAPSSVVGGRQEHLGGILLLRDVTDDGQRNAPGYMYGTSLREGSKRRKKASGDAYFKQILDRMPQMVWTTTPRGSHDFFNQNWYDFTGLEPEQSLGLGWQSPFHEDDMPAAIKAWSHSLETGDPYSVEYRCRRSDGAWRWMLGRALPLRSVTGEIEAWFGTCTDVDEFVNVRAQLAKTQEQFTAIIEGADVLIWAIDKDWKITFFSHPKSALVQGREMVGRDIKELWPESPLYGKCQEILDGVIPSARMEWLPSEVMTSFYRCLLTPLTETRPDGSVDIIGVIVVSTDVTDLNIAQERLRQSYEERAQIQASEAAANEASRLKSDYLASLSHEIRNPIAGMLGLAELLLDDEALAENHRAFVSKIMRSGEILLEMVGMVLDMGKVEAGKLELEHRAFRLEDVVTDARIFSVAASKKGLAFLEEIDTSLFTGQLLGDMPRLRQVIANLLSNAIKFTKTGSITFRIHQEGQTRSHVNVRIEVEDTGVGIKAEAIPQLFQPFHQADASTARQYGGTGLGLCIAKNLMELMGGTIELKSTYGKGTRMIVGVPLQKAPLTLVNMPAPDLPLGDLVREKVWILVTDDNELNREIITKTLTKMRFNVEAATDGLEAIAAVHRKRFDMILMDGQMHRLDGYEATRRIREDPDPQIANVKIVALTASAIAGDRERCLEVGMNDYLSKPVRAKALEAMIIKHLATSPPSSRRGSGSATPGAETVALMSMDFSPVVTVDQSSNSRRRPSHPSYSTDAVDRQPSPAPPPPTVQESPASSAEAEAESSAPPS